jgi:hypothetical protein
MPGSQSGVCFKAKVKARVGKGDKTYSKLLLNLFDAKMGEEEGAGGGGVPRIYVWQYRH